MIYIIDWMDDVKVSFYAFDKNVCTNCDFECNTGV